MDPSLSSHSLSLWKQRRLLQISEHCSRIAYSCSWDTLSSSSCSAIGWKGSVVWPGLGHPDGGSRLDWCVGVASGCCILTLGQASPKRWYQVSAATSCVCSPAYISQPWCNTGKDKRFTADMLAMLWTWTRICFLRRSASASPPWAQSSGQRFSTSEATTEEGTDLCINGVSRPDGTMRQGCNVWSTWFMFQPTTRRFKKQKTGSSGATCLPIRGPDHRYVTGTVHDYKLLLLTHVKHHMRPWCVTRQASFDCRMLPGYQITQSGAVCWLFQHK